MSLTLCRAVYDNGARCPWLACYDLSLVDVSIAQCTGPSLELCKDTEFDKPIIEVSTLLSVFFCDI